MRGTMSVRRKALVDRRETVAQRQVDEVRSVDVEAVEEECRERRVAAKVFDGELGTEAAHRHLKGLRPPVGPKRDRLSVEHDCPRRKRQDRVDDLRDSIGDVREVPREHPYLATDPVNLDPRTVELPFDRRRPDPLERVGHVVRGLRQHRLHRAKRAQAELREAVTSTGQRGLRNLGQIAREHGRAPNSSDGDAGRLRDRIDHHAFESTLPQLSHQQTAEKPLFRLGRSREQACELVSTSRLRATPGDGLQTSQRPIDLEHLETRRRIGGGREIAQGRPPHTDRSLR